LRFFLFFVDFGVFAGVAVGACGAFARVADALLGAKFVAGVGVGDGFDGRDGDDEWVALDVLRGDLDAIEGEACAAWIETAGIEGVEYLGEGDLDGTAVFEDAEPEVPVHFDGRRGGELVEAGVEVAIGLGAQSRCVALGSVGHDGPA
jgi:hypothetical protein